MGYIRHRPRMVQESVFQDLRDTLITCRWVVGTTSQPVRNPESGNAAELISTSAEQIFKLAEDHPIVMLDYFPEAQGESSGPTEENTFAIDTGRPGDVELIELGSTLCEQPYLFNFAFYAVSDAVAEAVFSDLKDRYEGRIVRDAFIDLFDYNDDPNASVYRMEVETFRYSRDVESILPNEVHLYFAELNITDVIDSS